MCEKLVGEDGYRFLECGKEDGADGINGINCFQIRIFCGFILNDIIHKIFKSNTVCFFEESCMYRTVDLMAEMAEEVEMLSLK